MKRIICAGILLVLLFPAWARTEVVEADVEGPPSSLPQDKFWAIATTAILADRFGQNHVSLGGYAPLPMRIEIIKMTLKNSWDVKDKASLIETLDWIDKGGHRKGFNDIGKALARMNPKQLAMVKKKAESSPDAKYKIEFVEENYATLGKKSLLGWDYCRYIALCRWGYYVGFLSEEDAWARIMPAARKLRATFDSWEDLGMNYVLGRRYWWGSAAGKANDDTLAACKKMVSDPNSPWNTLAWDVDMSAPEAAPAEDKEDRTPLDADDPPQDKEN